MTTIPQRPIAVNGIRMNVLVAGDEAAPPVLLIHGFPDDHTVWRHQVPALVAAGYRVIAPDTRGCGETEIPADRSTFHRDNLVADLVALLDTLGVDRVRVIGHDWGAVIGWLLAARHPERVERYLAMSVGHPYCYAHGGLMQKLRGWYVMLFQLRGLAAWLLRRGDFALVRGLLDHAAEWPRIRARFLRPGRLEAGMNYYIANISVLMSRPEPVDVPVWGVWSSGDKFLVEDQMKASERLVTKPWRYQRLDGVGHWLQLDAPERVNPILLDFLR